MWKKFGGRKNSFWQWDSDVNAEPGSIQSTNPKVDSYPGLDPDSDPDPDPSHIQFKVNLIWPLDIRQISFDYRGIKLWLRYLDLGYWNRFSNCIETIFVSIL